MYSAKFVSNSGKTFLFGKSGRNVFDIDGLSGVPVKIGTSQGFSQIGESVETQSVNGKTLTVRGVIYDDIQNRKAQIRNVFAPLQSGRLTFEDRYYMFVYVKASPTFSPIKNNGTFTMQLFAPFPFFRMATETTFYIGGITPSFMFPVNYEEPHIFGIKSPARYMNIVNGGDVPTSYRVDFTTEVESVNPVLTNLKTFEYLKINGTIYLGEVLSVYRDEYNVVRAELKGTDGITTDVFSWIEEGSTLFELAVGDNIISAVDDAGGNLLTAQITFNPAIGGVYES